jgi:hypothetical protein
MTHSERGANAAQLKADIDAGRTGDKVGGFDPGAAPLGTDEEAGGAPPSPGEVALAREAERSPRLSSARMNSAEPRLAPDGWSSNRRTSAIGFVIGGAAALLLAAVFLVAQRMGA